MTRTTASSPPSPPHSSDIDIDIDSCNDQHRPERRPKQLSKHTPTITTTTAISSSKSKRVSLPRATRVTKVISHNDFHGLPSPSIQPNQSSSESTGSEPPSLVSSFSEANTAAEHEPEHEHQDADKEYSRLHQSIVTAQPPSHPPRLQQQQQKQDSVVLEAYTVIRRLYLGQCGGQCDLELEWYPLRVEPHQYSQLCDKLKEDRELWGYFEDKVRHDYNPDRSCLCLRLMNTVTHELVQERILDHIKDCIRRLAAEHPVGNPSVAAVIGGIQSTGHAKATLNTANKIAATAGDDSADNKKCPDGQFREGRGRIPQFVLEVAFSQKTKHLSRLAREYYEDSDGQVKTVLTVDIHYRPRQKRKEDAKTPPGPPPHPPSDRSAVISLYRGAERIMHKEAFRDAHGQARDGTLRLQLTDFLSDKTIDEYNKALAAASLAASSGRRRRQGGGNLDVPRQLSSLFIDIQFCQLYDWLVEAEKLQATDDATPSPSPEPETFEAGNSEAALRQHKRKWVHWSSDEDSDGARGGSAGGEGHSTEDHDSSGEYATAGSGPSSSRRPRSTSKRQKTGSRDSNAGPSAVATTSTPARSSSRNSRTATAGNPASLTSPQHSLPERRRTRSQGRLGADELI